MTSSNHMAPSSIYDLMTNIEMALRLTATPWNMLSSSASMAPTLRPQFDSQIIASFPEEPSISSRSASLTSSSSESTSCHDIDSLAQAISSLILVRIIAIISTRKSDSRPTSPFACVKNPSKFTWEFDDLSTSTICHTILQYAKQRDCRDNDYDVSLGDEDGDNLSKHEDNPTIFESTDNNDPERSIGNIDEFPVTMKNSLSTLHMDWPELITQDVIYQVNHYIKKILQMYRAVPYHNAGHAAHVVLSANKLMDLMLCEFVWPSYNFDQSIYNERPTRKSSRPTYGIKSDPLAQLAFLFSALVHDVDHPGLSNGQLVSESDPLAILYNDQSVIEQRSLAVAFSLLVRQKYDALRFALFGGRKIVTADSASQHELQVGDSNSLEASRENYMKFRKIVIGLVLCTDISSPERMQIVKSKWKESFGEAEREAVSARRKAFLERKMKAMTINSLDSSEQLNGRSPSLMSQFWASRSSMGLGYVAGTTSSSSVNEVKNQSSEKKYHDDKGGDYVNHGEFDNFSSYSESPEESYTEDEDDDILEDPNDGVIVSGITLGSSIVLKESLPDQKGNRDDDEDSEEVQIKKNVSRRPSMTMSQSLRRNNKLKQKNKSKKSKRRGSNETYESANTNVSNFSRRHSAPISSQPRPHQFRLGIRRALDFSGRSIEVFNKKLKRTHESPDPSEIESRNTDFSASGGTNKTEFFSTLEYEYDPDEPDDLKSIVVLEQLLRIADVSASLQNWTNMLEWSGKLFKELKIAFLSGRSEHDPVFGWYENQITFLQSYILPLAWKLCEMGIFEESEANSFPKFVEENKRRWIKEGEAVCENMIQDWNAQPNTDNDITEEKVNKHAHYRARRQSMTNVKNSVIIPSSRRLSNDTT